MGKVSVEPTYGCRIFVILAVTQHEINRIGELKYFVPNNLTYAFNKNKTLFTSKLDLNLRKKLVKCYIWCMAFYGAETWTLRAADQKYLESF